MSVKTKTDKPFKQRRRTPGRGHSTKGISLSLTPNTIAKLKAYTVKLNTGSTSALVETVLIKAFHKMGAFKFDTKVKGKPKPITASEYKDGA